MGRKRVKNSRRRNPKVGCFWRDKGKESVSLSLFTLSSRFGRLNFWETRLLIAQKICPIPGSIGKMTGMMPERFPRIGSEKMAQTLGEKRELEL